MTFESKVQQLRKTIDSLRSDFPKGTPDVEIVSKTLSMSKTTLTPATLAKFASGRRRFSTGDVMQHFQVSKYKVAGSLATLSRTGFIRKTDKLDSNDYSIYEVA